MQFPHSLRRVGLGQSPPHMPTVNDAQNIQFQLQLATVNVLALEATLDAKEFGRRVGVRTQRLDAQWHDRGLHFLGLQEARTPSGCFPFRALQDMVLWSPRARGRLPGL